jgi:orotate phosphoribosyltransferase
MDELAKRLEGARERLVAGLRAHALVIGEVTLTSGARAEYYIDAKRAMLRADLFMDVGVLVAEQARTLRASAVGGVPVSAIPVACAALAAGALEGRAARTAPAGASDGAAIEGGRVEGCPSKGFIVRKEPKGHGMGRTIEGPPLDAGERCLLVEDVVTTGGSTIDVLQRLREQDLVIAGVVSVLDRLAGGGAAIEEATGAPYVPLTTIDDVYPERPDRRRG